MMLASKNKDDASDLIQSTIIDLMENKEKLNYAIQGVKELGKYAASKGLDLLIENHNGYSSDPEWMTSLMKGVNLKNVGILGDFTNWTLERNPDTFYPDPYRGFEIFAPYIRAISAKSESFDKNGEEINTDFSKMLNIVSNHNYDGYIGIEYEGSIHTEFKGIALTRDLLKRHQI